MLTAAESRPHYLDHLDPLDRLPDHVNRALCLTLDAAILALMLLAESFLYPLLFAPFSILFCTPVSPGEP
jgi:hypothetical protein